jgi:anti-anti-sigma regulatory factor
MSQSLFKVENQTLTLYRNPDPIENEQVKQALYAMAGEGGDDATLDMSALPGISSTTVGMTVAVHLRFSEAGKHLRIRLNPKLLKLFELTMLTDTLSLEMVGPDGDADGPAQEPEKEQAKPLSGRKRSAGK